MDNLARAEIINIDPFVRHMQVKKTSKKKALILDTTFASKATDWWENFIITSAKESGMPLPDIEDIKNFKNALYNLIVSKIRKDGCISLSCFLGPSFELYGLTQKFNLDNRLFTKRIRMNIEEGWIEILDWPNARRIVLE